MKFIFGLLLGLALGIAAGVLLAPQSGEDIRAMLGDQSITLRDRSGNIVDTVRSRATDAMAQGRDMYSRTKDDLSDRYSKAKSGVLG